MDGKTGTAQLIESGVWLERTADLEVLKIGRDQSGSNEVLVLQMGGEHLCYSISLKKDGPLRLIVYPMDGPETEMWQLLQTEDTAKGWQILRTLTVALEREGIRSVKERPIELRGGTGSNAFVIG